MFIGKYDKSVVVTFLGTLSAMIGMYFILGYDEPRLTGAIICLIIAGICDMFDGKVARMCKRTEEEKLFGIQIDSLADMVGFVVFPVIIGYSIGLNAWYNILGYVLLVLAGITRLGFFNISVSETNKDVPVKTYSGLPVTSTSIIIPLLWFACEAIKGLSFETIYPFVTYLIAFLFVFNIKIPKLKGKAYVVVAIVALLGLALLLWV